MKRILSGLFLGGMTCLDHPRLRRRRFDKLGQSYWDSHTGTVQPEADVAQLVEQPIRNALSLAYVVVEYGGLRVVYRGF
jgi:hypothetical protein